jgi:hypothetical protein
MGLAGMSIFITRDHWLKTIYVQKGKVKQDQDIALV